jgi:hypothetical protein
MLPDMAEDKSHDLNLTLSSKSNCGICDDVLDAENKVRTIHFIVHKMMT